MLINPDVIVAGVNPADGTVDDTAPGYNTYEVRASNAAGTDPTPAKGNIWIDDRPFSAAVNNVEALANDITNAIPGQLPSDAGAHPDVTASLSLYGPDDPQTVNVKFPDGLEGSLRAIPQADRCVSTHALNPTNNAQDGTCPASALIGTAVATAESPTDGAVTANGNLYLVDSPGLDPKYAAGVAASFLNIPGPVTPNLGSVIVTGGLVLSDQARNLTTELLNIPRVTTTGKPFHLIKGDLTIQGDAGPDDAKPLITNPHFCNDAAEQFDARPNLKQFVGGGTSWQGTSVDNITADYFVTNCAAVPFNPEITTSLTNPSAGGSTGLDATVTLPTDNSTLRGLKVTLPPFAALNFPSFGVAADQCVDATDATGSIQNVSPPGTLPAYNTFIRNSDTCPTQAMVGTATISTPLLDNDVTGNVYLIGTTPVPALGIDVNPDIPGNPQGVNIGLVGFNATIPATCSFGACTLVQSTFNSVPDVPISSVHLHLGDVAGRISAGPGNPVLNPNILNIASATAASCKNSGQGATAEFTPWRDGPGVTVVSPLNATGCNDPKLLFTAPVLPTTGAKIVNTTATTTNVAYTINGSTSFPAPSVETGTTTCVVKNLTSGTTVASTSTSTNSVALVVGVNDIQISCTDAKGTGTVNRRVDRAIPSVAINSPSNGSSTPLANASVTLGITNNGAAVTGAITAPLSCNVTNNGGAPVSVTNAGTAVNVPLSPGINNLVGSCTNASGTGTSASVQVTYAAPNVTWFTASQTVPNATTTINASYRVNGLTTIPAGSTCTLNGVANTTPATNNVSLAVGTNTFTVQCTNVVGSTSAVLTITRLP